MANPTSVFRAMATESPYPIKAFFALGNNALWSYPNQHQILEGLMNQEGRPTFQGFSRARGEGSGAEQHDQDGAGWVAPAEALPEDAATVDIQTDMVRFPYRAKRRSRRTFGKTSDARYSMRRLPLSTGSPGNCAQKCTSAISG